MTIFPRIFRCTMSRHGGGPPLRQLSPRLHRQRLRLPPRAHVCRPPMLSGRRVQGRTERRRVRQVPRRIRGQRRTVSRNPQESLRLQPMRARYVALPLKPGMTSNVVGWKVARVFAFGLDLGTFSLDPLVSPQSYGIIFGRFFKSHLSHCFLCSSRILTNLTGHV